MADPADIVSKYESQNRPLIGWGEADLSGYPLGPDGFPIWPGKMGPQGVSRAAGLYQFQPGTWAPAAKRLGITDFSPESQRRVFDEVYRTEGYRPWAPYNPKLAKAVGWTGSGSAAETPAEGPSPEGYRLTIPGGRQEGGATAPRDQFDWGAMSDALIASLATKEPAGAQEALRPPTDTPQQEDAPASAADALPAVSAPLPAENVLASTPPLTAPAAAQEQSAAAPAAPIPIEQPKGDMWSGLTNALTATLNQMSPVGSAQAAPPPQMPAQNVSPPAPAGEIPEPRGSDPMVLQLTAALNAQQPDIAAAQTTNQAKNIPQNIPADPMVAQLTAHLDAAEGKPETATGSAGTGWYDPITSGIRKGYTGEPGDPPVMNRYLQATLETPGAMVGGLARGVVEGLRAPGDVLSGRVDPVSNNQPALDTAMLIAGAPGGRGGLGSGARRPGPLGASGSIRLYRGEGPQNRTAGGWFTTDPTKAALYGKVSYVDVPVTEMKRFAQGHGGPDEWMTTDPAILNLPRQPLRGDPSTAPPPLGGGGGAPPPGGGLGATPPGGPIRAAASAVRDLFSRPPERAARASRLAGKEDARATLRESMGLARREKAIAVAALEDTRGMIAPHVEPYRQYIADVHSGRPAEKPALARLTDFIEGSSARLETDFPELLPLARQLRQIYRDAETAIRTEIPEMENFITDYYAHRWERPQQAAQIFGSGRQGSGQSLRKREIPTMDMGISMGLTPRFLDPIENTLHYVSGMHDYLATHRSLRVGEEMGQVKRATEAPEPGWVPLRGSQVTKPVGPGAMQHTWGAPGFAAVYNHWAGKGFHEWPMAGSVYDKALGAANAVTGLKLGLSGFHAWNIAQESAVAGFAKAFGSLRHGELAAALKDVGLSATVAPKLAENLVLGRRLQQQYLKVADYGPEMERFADILARSGGRAVGRGGEYRAGALENFWRAWKRGTLKMEYATGLRNVLGKAEEAPAMRGLMAGPRAAAMFGREVGRIMDTVSAPLFDTMIPKVKNAAWMDEMELWLRKNPAASEKETLAEGRRLVDSMDDRFGEMIQDNLFWPRAVKQSLNLLAVSVGWEYGSLRAFGGAAKDILSGKFSTRTRWLMSFPIVMGISGSVYQYLKTGKTPGQDAGGVLSPAGALDLALPQTGGATPEGAPERALLPGYEKDPLHWYKEFSEARDPMGAVQAGGRILAGKLNPAMQIGKGLATGKNYFGQDIPQRLPLGEADGTHERVMRGMVGERQGQVPAWWQSYSRFVLEGMEPIPFQAPRLPSSGLTEGERFAGVRPAPEFMQNPSRTQIQHEKQEIRLTREEAFTRARGLMRQGKEDEARETLREHAKLNGHQISRILQGWRVPGYSRQDRRMRPDLTVTPPPAP